MTSSDVVFFALTHNALIVFFIPAHSIPLLTLLGVDTAASSQRQAGRVQPSL